ncbi:SPOR domain-containing protein [Sphingomonas flavescens]|uniref:SPOR domain-containing protein n=1 Tax=Sphingomonas flavescens TaxID=3132797 RepID=UPI002803A3E7|nr:SPOR domain-containing protein [Sphingomonas limnosediminicola]
MNMSLRTTTAASLVVLASMVAGCATSTTRVNGAQFGGKADVNVGLATKALAALNSNNVPMAIDYAERAVAKTPNDAGFRTLLGNAYFAGGRFRSAEAAYRDSLTLYPEQPQIVLKLALVQIAQGKNRQAVGFLAQNRGSLNVSDYGLALALAGQPGEAVAVLDSAARSKDADATVRQNLALAHALAGQWEEARVIASQDVPAGQLDGRIQQWMKLASPKSAADQVASLVGVTPAAVDAGQPVQLALNKTDTQVADVAAPVAAAVVAAAAPVAKPQPAPLAPQPAPVQLAVAPAPPPPRPTTLTSFAMAAVNEAKAAVAAMLPAKATVRPVKASYSKSRPVASGTSAAVVQLGAYGSPQRVLAAWNETARKYSALKGYAPMSARFASAKGTFYRLSVHGFASDRDARLTCEALRRQGGSCFVRNTAGDAPVQVASR